MLRFSIVLFLLTAIIGCSSISVSTDYDPQADFTNYKTFAVQKEAVEGSELENYPLIKNRIISAIGNTMKSKGFLLDESGNADINIFTFAGTKEKMNVTESGYGYGGYWRGNPYGRNIDVSYYTQASLVIDLVDNVSDELVWRGIGTGVVVQNRTPEESQKAVDEAVSEILKDFPPGKK